MEFFVKQVFPWLVEIATVSTLLPFIAALLIFRKKKSLQFRLLFLFVIFLVTFEAISMLTVHFGTKNNIWIMHIYTVLEFYVLAAIYYHSFEKVYIRRGIIAAAVILTIVSIVDATLIDGLYKMDSTTRMVGNSVLIAFAVLYFYKVADDLRITYLDTDAIFLLSCGLLIYKAGTSMSFAMFNQALAKSYDAATLCLAVMLVLNILFNSSLILVLRRTAIC